MKKVHLEEKLNNKYDDVIYKIHAMINDDKELKNIFGNKLDRVDTSCCALLIYVDNRIIGFLNLVKEQIEGFLYVDIGILKEYRSNGYGTEALALFKKLISTDQYIIIETTKNNVRAKKILDNISIPIYEQKNLVFYLLQTELKEQLLNSNSFDKFISHCNFPRNKQCLEIHKILTKTM